MSGAAEKVPNEIKKKKPSMKARKGAGEKARDAREGVATIESIHEDLLGWNVIGFRRLPLPFLHDGPPVVHFAGLDDMGAGHGREDARGDP